MRNFTSTKPLLLFLTLSVLTIIIFSRCGTIAGGSTYKAHVTVLDHPNATIMYNNKSERGSIA